MLGAVPAELAQAASSEALDRLRARPMISLNRTMEVYPDRVSRLTQQLAERGFDVEQTADVPRTWTPEEVVWVYGDAAWFPKVLASISELEPSRRPSVVLWHSEPLPPPRASGLRWPVPTVRELGKIVLRDLRASDVYTNWWAIRKLAKAGLPDALVVTSRERQEFLTERGVQADFVPDGSEPLDGEDLGLDRDIDVLLLGAYRLRSRRRAVARLRKAGIRVQTKGDYFDPSLWGESRTRLINRTKIMLSVSRFPGTFATGRFLMSMACGALVVSDPLFDSAPYEPGVHFVETTIEELPATVARYLEDEDARRRIAQAGHELVTKELTMERCFAKLLDVVATRLAAR
jgi:hypothetical protein